MNERDELAERIKGEISHHISPVIGWLRLDALKGRPDEDGKRHDAWLERLDKAAEAVAELIRPRTVTTAAELDDAIIRAFENGENLVLLEKGGWRPYILWEDDRGDLRVTSAPMEDDPERLTLNDIHLPATVLHEPTP